MKAVLEFNYPDDEDKLRHALNGTLAICVLLDIRQMIKSWEKHDGTAPEMMISRIRDSVNSGLNECGED